MAAVQLLVAVLSSWRFNTGPQLLDELKPQLLSGGVWRWFARRPQLFQFLPLTVGNLVGALQELFVPGQHHQPLLGDGAGRLVLVQPAALVGRARGQQLRVPHQLTQTWRRR